VELEKLALKDKKLFKRFLSQGAHDLSVYAFENIYIWKGLFDISWLLIEDSLCVFFRDNIGCFMYLAPLGANINEKIAQIAFTIMDRFNKNKTISRIENVEAGDLKFYEALGYETKLKSYDYVCLRRELANLKGNQFKHKRSSCNYFLKHYKWEYLPFLKKYSAECLSLYDYWRKQREEVNQDRVYQLMQQDSLTALKTMLHNFKDLKITGRVVRINKQIKAFSFGFALNPQTFCILYEITDLNAKGLAQFIFRAFARELKDYKYINIMDDSGLENLKQVKLSYHPAKLIPAYIAKRHEPRYS
jgi:uncharacterized protein